MYALVDCDNFYASCERLFRPDLRKTPIAILSNNDGCIIARSKEVKELGIKMGAPYFKVREELRRHKVEVFSSNYELYADISARVMDTLRQFSPGIEVYSIDECFIDLSGFQRDLLEYGIEIKNTVGQWTRIPVGVGIAPTKTLAKVANKLAKSCQGVCVIRDSREINNALAHFPVGDVWGIGRNYEKFLAEQNILTAGDLIRQPDAWVRQHLTVVGLRIVYELRGISCIPLEEMPTPQKALAVTRSFGRIITEWPDMGEAIIHYITRAAEKLRAKELAAKRIQVFLHTSPHASTPFYSKSAQADLPHYSNATPDLIRHGKAMLQGIFRPGFRFVKCGVILTDLIPEAEAPIDLFQQEGKLKSANLMAAVDRINQVNGKHTIFFAGSGIEKGWGMQRSSVSPNYTTSWHDLPVVRV